MKSSRSLVMYAATLASAMLLTLPAGSIAAEPASSVSPKPAQVAVASTPININTATADMFARLNGVGDKKAADIVAYRTTNGNFTKVEDLLNVKGIGEKTLEKNRHLLAVH